MVIFDSNFLLTFICDVKTPPTDPQTGDPTTYYVERVSHLIKSLSDQNEQIGIPTPVIAEVGMRTEKSTRELVEILSRTKWVKFLEFDVRAAIECATLNRKGFDIGNKRYDANPDTDWQKLKVDRQIFGIAKANNASRIYTSDKDLLKMGATHDIECTPIYKLPIPEKARQMQLEGMNVTSVIEEAP